MITLLTNLSIQFITELFFYLSPIAMLLFRLLPYIKWFHCRCSCSSTDRKIGKIVGEAGNVAINKILRGQGKRSNTRREMPRTNYLINLFFPITGSWAMFDRRVHAPLQLRSCANQLPSWVMGTLSVGEGRVLITVWVVSVRVSVSCALKRKEDWCYYSTSIRAKDSTYPYWRMKEAQPLREKGGGWAARRRRG